MIVPVPITTVQVNTDNSLFVTTGENRMFNMIESLKQQEAAALKAKNEKLATLVKQEMRLRDEIVRLKVIAAGPPAQTFEGGCREAFVLMREYAVNRMLDATENRH